MPGGFDCTHEVHILPKTDQDLNPRDMPQLLNFAYWGKQISLPTNLFRREKKSCLNIVAVQNCNNF